VRGRPDFTRAPFTLSSRGRTCRCAPWTWQPNAAADGIRCRSSRRRPSASPIRSPPSSSTVNKNRSRADNAAPNKASASSSVKVCGGRDSSAARSTDARTTENSPFSPRL